MGLVEERKRRRMPTFSALQQKGFLLGKFGILMEKKYFTLLIRGVRMIIK